MRLYAAMAEPTAALRHYEELAALLKEELGVAPSAATRALSREIADLVTQGVNSGEGSALEAGHGMHSVVAPSPSPLGCERSRGEAKGVGVPQKTAHQVNS